MTVITNSARSGTGLDELLLGADGVGSGEVNGAGVGKGELNGGVWPPGA